MDILKPHLVWIDGRCYRKLPIRGSDEGEREENHSVSRRKEPQFEEDDDIDLPIKHEGQKFYITINVPEAVIGYVKGTKGRTKAAIERETSTRIVVPQKASPEDMMQKKSQDILITIDGLNKRYVGAAYRRIEHIANSARWKEDYTHFISIPMNNNEILKGYDIFKKDVLQNCRGVSGINESTFEPPARLHLTFAMLTLLTETEKERASALLQSQKTDILHSDHDNIKEKYCIYIHPGGKSNVNRFSNTTVNPSKNQILEMESEGTLANNPHLIGEKSLRVVIKGVEFMNDDPSEVDVLYGKVQETDSDNCLQMIADKLADNFAEKNLSRKCFDHVKLHVTLMKSRSKMGDKGTFDARKILQKYEDYTFGQMTIKEIHISVRYTGGANYYLPSYVLEL